MPFGLGKNEDASIQPLDNDDVNEIKKIQEMLNPNEDVLVVARQSRVRPGGSAVTPNIIYATNRLIIIRDPQMLGIKENVVDIPYDVITSVKLEKGLLSSTIKFEAPELVGSKRLGMIGMIEGIVRRENDHEGVVEAIPKRKAEDVIQIIRSGMHNSSYSSNEIHSASRQSTIISNYSSSIADELTKLRKLREQGVITEEEFVELKKMY